MKRPVPFTHSTPFALKRPATPCVICVDDAGLPGVRGGEVEVRLADPDAELREALLGLPEREGGLHPRLRRDAADAEAGAAELGLLLDAGDRRAQLRGADRGGVAARAAPEDGDVNVHVSSPVGLVFDELTGGQPQLRDHRHGVAVPAHRRKP